MKTALVFGHTSGMGYAITDILLKKQYKVIGFARSQSNMKSENLESIQVDLLIKEDVEKAIKLVNEKHSQFDALIYCSGALTTHSIDSLDYQETEKLFKILVIAPMILESKLIPLIKRNKADVVNITSTVLLEHYPAFAEYTSAKAAMEKFTMHLQTEFKNTGVRVIEVLPGAFRSNIYKNMTGDKVNRNEEAQPNADDYARVITYLLELPKHIKVPYIYIDKNT